MNLILKHVRNHIPCAQKYNIVYFLSFSSLLGVVKVCSMGLMAQISYLSTEADSSDSKSTPSRASRLHSTPKSTESGQATRLDSTQVDFIKSTWGVGVASRGNTSPFCAHRFAHLHSYVAPVCRSRSSACKKCLAQSTQLKT
jgi:hypothetical protein